MRLRDFIHAHEKSVTFPPPISIKLTTATTLHVHISYPEFHPYRIIHVESILRHSFKLQIFVIPCTDFYNKSDKYV